VDDLYQELILHHNKNPLNKHDINNATHRATGYNPLCGDQITVSLIVQDGIIEDISFEGYGCAISTASSSLMTESVKGKTVEEINKLFEKVHSVFTGKSEEDLGKLDAFSNISNYPARVKCATLSWHTIMSAIKGNTECTTE